MGKRPKVAYIVFEGRQPGVYDTWDDAEAQVKGFSGATFRGLTAEEGGLKRGKEEFREHLRKKTLAASAAPPPALPPAAAPRTIINLISPEKAPPSRKSHNIPTPPQPRLGKERQRPQSWDEPDIRARRNPWLDYGPEGIGANSFDQPVTKYLRCPRALGGDASSGTDSESTSSSDEDDLGEFSRTGANHESKAKPLIRRNDNACDSGNPTLENDDERVKTGSSITPEPTHVKRLDASNQATKEGKARSMRAPSKEADYISFAANDEDDDFNERFLDPSKADSAGEKIISHISKTNTSFVEKPIEPELTTEQRALVDVILSGRNVFYTGSAGTGKSTVLNAFKKLLQNVDIIAPTGIAALQVGGVTSYVYAGWNVSSQQKPLAKLAHNATFQKRVHERLCKTKVLVIDEISMMENHHFERLDAVMRASRGFRKKEKDPGQKRCDANDDDEDEIIQHEGKGDPRNRSLPFGGVQLVVTGDFCQLPPVKPFEHCLHCGSEMKRCPAYQPKFHTCPKCHASFKNEDKWAFCSQTWQNCDFHYTNLNTIHRQSDPKFIDILQRCRLGEIFTEADRKLLLYHPSDTANATILSCRRVDVQDINDQEFARLKDPIRTYPCYDAWNCSHDYLRDYFTTTSYTKIPKIYDGHQMTDRLQLRRGMRVALLANVNPELGLVNGTTGVVEGFSSVDPEKIPESKVEDADHQKEQFLQYVEMLKVNGITEWPVVRFHSETPGDRGRPRLIKAVCRISNHGYPQPSSWASRTQIPLMPAWAMTVHKSQGMTLSKVEVDLSKTFEAGQDYVALSRARGLNGLKVTSLSKQPLGGNPEVLQFMRDKFGIGTGPPKQESTQARGSTGNPSDLKSSSPSG